MSFRLLRVRRDVLATFAALALIGSPASAQVMYAVDSSRALFTVDIATGVKTAAGTVSANAGTTAGLAYNTNTNTMFVSSSGNDSLYTLDLVTGNATLVGAFGDTAIVMHGLEYVASTNTLFGVSSHNNGLYNISMTTGVATLIGTSSLASFTNLGYNSDTGIMYAVNTTTPESTHTIDLTTGAATFVGLLGAVSSNPNGMAYNRDNQTMYMIDNTTDDFYFVDLATGAATVIGDMGAGNLLGLAYVPNPIPEPTSIALVGIGAAAVWIRRRRKAG